MLIGIIGYGVVGRAAEATFSIEYDVLKYDKFGNFDSFESLINCDFILIAVPTPFDHQKNKSDDSAVIESLEKLESITYPGIIMIKSTLVPGCCKNYNSLFDLKIVHNPEFLRESITPNEDFKNQDTVVIGTEDEQIFDSVKKLYQKGLLNEM